MAKPDEPFAPTVPSGATDPAFAPTVAGAGPGFTPAPKLPEGTRVGRYVVLEPIGEGGMGVVYLAHDPELDRRVALKVLRPEKSAGPAAQSVGRSRMVREAHAMAKLSHPNVVTIHDAGVYGDEVFLAVELIEGTTLRTWLSQPRGWREILGVFLQAGRGLAAAHAAGLVHRDFKPENVLIGKGGEVKVTDFGLARAASFEPDATAGVVGPGPMEMPLGGLLVTPITHAGAVSGTPAFMAPEQHLGRPADGRTDEFSFCVALYWALYGEWPFEARLDPLGLNHVKPPPRGTHVPAWVRDPLLRGLSTKPEDRYATLAELLDRLADDPAVRRRRLLGWAGAIALALTAIGVTTAVFLRQRAAADPCHDPDGELAGVWDDATRARVRAAFAATGAPDAAGTEAYAEKALNRVSAAWVAAYRDACLATRERHAQPEAALRLRLDCLDDQRLDLRATLDLMSQPDPKNLSAAIGAAFELPLPGDCSDARALSVVEQPSPERLPAIEALRKRLARGRALLGAGQYGKAIEVLQPLPAEASALGDRPLRARALYDLASALRAHGDFTKAAEQERQAESLASDVHLDALAAKAAAALALDLIFTGGPRAEIDDALAHSQEALRRAPAGSSAAYFVERSEDIAAAVRNRNTEAVAHSRRALDLAQRDFGPDSQKAAEAAANLAAALEPLGQYDEMARLFRGAIDAASALLGPKTRLSLNARINLAELLFDMQRLDEADDVLKEVSPILGRQQDFATAIVLALRAAILGERGQTSQSLSAAAQALDLGSRLHVLTSPNFVDIHRYTAEARLRDGRADLAVPTYETYLAHQDIPPKSPAWVTFLRLGGWAYLDSGQPAKALPLLERALELSTVHPFYPGWVPRLRYQLARALVETHGDRRRAEILAQQAHDELVRLPVAKDLLAEVDGWRAKTLASR